MSSFTDTTSRPALPRPVWLLFAFLFIVGLFTTGSAIGAPAVPSPTAGECEQWLNTGWKFYRVDTTEPDAPQAPDFDDSQWDTVTLPHTPRIEKYDQTHPWQGICWYRRKITPDPMWRGKRVTLQFGAAMQVADVWVNGIQVAHHLGGYLPFTVDLTDAASAGAAITVATRLDNRDTDQVAPGKPTDGLDFNYPGGLYRGVTLIVTDPVHVTDPVAADIVAGGGIFVTYTDVSAASATINVKTDVADDSSMIAHQCTVRSTLMDATGLLVKRKTSAPVMISAGGHHEFAQSLTIAGPNLWDPDHPYLYTLVTTVSHDGHPADEVRTRVGIRAIALGRGGLQINGKVFHISGSNRHQEYPYLEYALSPNASRRDAQRIKDAGLNFIRLSHYPQDPAFLDACDALGILVQAPAPGWQFFADNPSFVTNTYQNIRDLIRRDRNHPSIIFWEPNLNETNPPTDWCEAAYEIAHQEYPGDQCLTFGDPYPSGWHGWDVRDFTREYGDFGFGGNESTSRQTRGQGEGAMLQQAWNFIWSANGMAASWDNPNSDFIGYATWCMFDYNRGYYQKQEQSGMMDIFRLPKYVYEFYASQRDPSVHRNDTASGPMVFLATDWTRRAPTTKVVVFSNCDEVEISVNGRLIRRQKPDSGPDTPYSSKQANLRATVGSAYDSSGGDMFDGGNGRHLAHPMFTFMNVPYAPGTVRAVGYLHGMAVAEDAVRTPETPRSLKLDFDTQRIPLTADGSDAIFVRGEILDRNGTVVPVNAWPTLVFSVTGPARLVGTAPVHVEAGVASVLLQSTGGIGPIQVTVTGRGLRSATAMVMPSPAPGPTPRTPGLLPAPRTRPGPTSFTKLTGAVIGTPGSYQGGPTDISKAFDGDTSTYVDAAESTSGDGCWLGLDLGVPKTITRIRFFPRAGHGDRMASGKFQGSDTPDFSRDVVEIAAIDTGPVEGQWTDITEMETAQAFRYVRYLSPDGGWNNIAELEFDTSP